MLSLLWKILRTPTTQWHISLNPNKIQLIKHLFQGKVHPNDYRMCEKVLSKLAWCNHQRQGCFFYLMVSRICPNQGFQYKLHRALVRVRLSNQDDSHFHLCVYWVHVQCFPWEWLSELQRYGHGFLQLLKDLFVARCPIKLCLFPQSGQHTVRLLDVLFWGWSAHSNYWFQFFGVWFDSMIH